MFFWIRAFVYFCVCKRKKTYGNYQTTPKGYGYTHREADR